MTIDTFDHYAMLEVTATASQAELKSAYLRLVRAHTPESDPERFRLISEAYRILSNPEKRRQYDSQERLPDEVQQLICHLMATAIEGEDETALERIGDLCSEYPDSHALRFSLGVALDKLERNVQAAEVFEELFNADPSSAVYATWLGDSLLKVGNHQAGVQRLKEAIVLDRDCSDAYLCLARFHSMMERDSEALNVLDRGINADGVVDVQDLPLFVQKVLTLAKSSNWEKLKRTATELVSAIPESDAEARSYAASQLGPLVPIFAQAERPDLTHYALDVMRKLDPANAEIREMADGIEDAALFFRGKAALYEDTQVADWVKANVAVWSGDEVLDDPETVGQNMFMFWNSRPQESLAEWDRAKSRHPNALAPLQDKWNAVAKSLRLASPLASAPRGSGVQHSSVSASSGDSGCAVLLLFGATAILAATRLI